MSQKIYLNWNDDSLWWIGGPSGPPGSVDYIWSEVFILIEVANKLGAGGYLPDDHPWDWLERKLDPKTSEEFKKIIIKVNNIAREKPQTNLKITVDHIRNTFAHYDVKVDIFSETEKEVQIENPIKYEGPAEPKGVFLVSEPSLLESKKSVNPETL